MIRLALAPIAAVKRMRDNRHRAAIRSQLEAVASGKSSTASIRLDHSGVDVAGVMEEVTAEMTLDSLPLRRLVAVLTNSGTIDKAVERLEAKNVQQRTTAARTIGALRIYEAVGGVAPLLASRDRHVSDAAARALGKIGGAHSASALVAAIHRRGTNRRLVAELARGAPDWFIESALNEPQKPGVRPALALAAGLRRRRTAISQLMTLIQNGTRRERFISCRALGWIGATTAIPAITEVLTDRDWKLRMSGAKALGALRARAARGELRYLQVDRNPRVREAARQALRRIDKEPSRGS